MKCCKQGIAGKIGSGAAGVALVVVIVAAVCLTLANLRVRLDLTEQKLYSLSTGTRQILSKLDNEVRLKFYFNRSSPDVAVEMKTYARHVEDLLQEYRLAGHGRMVVETYDPKPDSDEEEWANRQGLEPQTVSPFAPPIYLGVVAKCGEETQCIPALSPNEDAKLEYNLTRLIARVAFPKKPVLGVLSSLPVLGMPPNPMMMQQRPSEGWLAFRELKNDYDVRTVPPEPESIDPEVGTLIVIHPKNASEKTLFAIDQFVLRGGRLIVCVDPMSGVDARNADPSNPMAGMMGIGSSSTLGRLFEAWGVGFDSTKTIADMRAVTQLMSGRNQIVDSPTFLSIDPKGINREDVLLAQVEKLHFPFAGGLVDRTGGKRAFTPLVFSSTDASCPIDAMGSQFATATSIRSAFKPDNLRHVLAARLKGAFHTAFPKGPSSTDTNAAPNQLVSGNSGVVIFADTDFLADENCVRATQNLFGSQSYQPINDNLVLFLNTVEQLSGREELIGIRARGVINRPFAVVNELEYRALRAWQAKEGELSKELEETRRQIQELQQEKKGAQKFLLSREQQAAVERFRSREMEINRELKEVRKSLRQDIDSLGVTVKAVNIALIPLLVIAFGVTRTLARRRRRS